MMGKYFDNVLFELGFCILAGTGTAMAISWRAMVEGPITCLCFFVVGTIVISIGLTLPSPKERGFSDYAQADASRWCLRGLPDPIHSSGLDFPRKPNFRNHQSKLLKSFGRQTLSLFRFFRLAPTNIGKIVAQFKGGVKPDSSPVLKYGVFSGVSINR